MKLITNAANQRTYFLVTILKESVFYLDEIYTFVT